MWQPLEQIVWYVDSRDGHVAVRNSAAGIHVV
jgi:hypothetical protein